MILGVVILKNVYFPEVHNHTFIPPEQQVNSIITYTGNGYIPCGGVAPAPTDCDFPKYKAKVQRPYPT